MADTRGTHAVHDPSGVPGVHGVSGVPGAAAGVTGDAGSAEARTEALLDEEEEQSFPASDAHADWAGPPSWLSEGRPVAGAADAAGAAGAAGGAAGGRQGPEGGGGGPRRSLRVAGIPVRANATLLVIAGLLAWSFWLRYSAVASRGGALAMALVATALFVGSILAHELAHALEARRRGLGVRDIVLSFFGGVTRMSDEVERPADEFALTAVGPWTSIVLGGAFGLVATAADHLGLPAVAEVTGELGWLNAIIGIFNLLPGAPLDGGRILDSIVWRVTGDRGRAARVSALTGQLIGAGLIALGVAEMLVLLGGFVGGLWLMLIGWFLVRAAATERQVAAVRDRMRGRQVGDVARPVAAAPAGAPLAFAVDALLVGGGSDVVAVTRQGGIVGAVTIAHLRAVPDEERAVRTVDEVMTPVAALPGIQAAAPASRLLPLLDGRPVAVLDGDAVRTLVTGTQLEVTVAWLPPLPPAPQPPAPAGGAPSHRGPAGGVPSAPAGPASARRRGSGLLVGLLAASGAVVVAAVAVVPMPLVEVSPGPALDVPTLLRTEGPVHDVRGKLLLTSVRLGAPSIAATVGALFDPHRDVLSRTTVVPAGIDPAVYEAAQRQLYLGSVQLASAVALRAAGYPVTVTGGGAVVRAVATGGPATGVLAPGDVVTAVTGQKVDTASDLVAHLSSVPSGTPVALQVQRGDRRLVATVSPTWSSELDRPVYGIAVEDAAPFIRLPFSVQSTRTDIGGPSAGLMTALAVYALTTGADLTGGRTVAGTGTIDAQGRVGPVGGIAQKVAAASAAGASVMLVPGSEAAAARRAAEGLGIEVVAVPSFSAALARLGALGPA